MSTAHMSLIRQAQNIKRSCYFVACMRLGSAWTSLRHCHTLYTIFIRWNEVFALILAACNSGTAQWKNCVPGSYCKATQELQSRNRTMRISPRECKCLTFCIRHFMWALANSMHKNIHHRTLGHLQVMGFEWKKVEELLYLLVFVWSP